jgi:CheY-like chemotaxis protein
MLGELRADLILVVEDVRETSDGIERLLKADGYRVALARDELDAIESVKLRRARSNTGELDGIIR